MKKRKRDLFTSSTASLDAANPIQDENRVTQRFGSCFHNGRRMLTPPASYDPQQLRLEIRGRCRPKSVRDREKYPDDNHSRNHLFVPARRGQNGGSVV